MKRRHFLVGVGSASIGGSALVGSGAYSRVEAQRNAMIQVADDADAYLGLEGCLDSPNQSYTSDDGAGHLTIEMTDENPTDAGGQGINSNSLIWFDRVFQICNNGKQPVCVWIGDDNDWPRVDDNEFDEDYSEYDGERRVDFYYESDRERSLIGEENGVVLDVGACTCVGISTISKGLTEGDTLLDDLDDGIVINADEGGECPGPEIPPEENDIPDTFEATAISFIAFCSGGTPNTVTDVTVTHVNDDGEPTGVSWSTAQPVHEVVLFGGGEWYLYTYENGATGGQVKMDEGDADDFKEPESPARFRFDSDGDGDALRCQASPCLGTSGLKLEYNGGFDITTPEYTKEECPPGSGGPS